MKTNYFKQVWHDLRYQPVMGAVSIIGTAMAIFLIMVEVMMASVKTDPLDPENNRDRLLYGRVIKMEQNDYEQGGWMSLPVVNRLYGNLEGAEPTGIHSPSEDYLVYRPEGDDIVFTVAHVNDAFLHLFDYKWLAGGPFDHTAFEAGSKVMAIDETRARALFGTPEAAIGRTVQLSIGEYMVTGVFEDVSSLASTAFSNAFIPFTSLPKEKTDFTYWLMQEDMRPYLGFLEAVIVARSKSDIPGIRAQVKARMQALQSDMRADSIRLIDLGAPYDQETSQYVSIYQCEPERVAQERKRRWFIYALILLIPAINLSSMTTGRLQHRISEIGVRRAFGARRSDVMLSILTENLIVTAIGAAIGLLLCWVFAYFYSGTMFLTDHFEALTSTNPKIPLSFLFNWRVFGMALLFSFVLNMLSAGIPAWRAARLDPVNALNNRLKKS